MVGQALVGLVGVDVVVRVVVIVRAVGVEREVVLVRSRREMRVFVTSFVEGRLPGQRGRDVERGGMWGLRKW